MTESASTSPSQAQQAQQSSPLREMRETQETPGTQENQPTQEPSAHQEEQPLAKPKITREEIAQHPLDKRAVITISAAFLITFAFDRLICSMPPTWLIGYELPVFWIICALTVTALHWKTARKQVLVWLVLGSIVAIGVWNMLARPRAIRETTNTRSPRNSFNRRCLCCTVSWSTGVTMFAVHFKLFGIGLPAGCSSRLFTFAILRNHFPSYSQDSQSRRNNVQKCAKSASRC